MGSSYKKITEADLGRLLNDKNIKFQYGFIIQLMRKWMEYTLRKVTLDEIREYTTQNQLVLDHAVLSTYAKKVYGDKAHNITTEVSWEYNDEGGTDPHLDTIKVYDVEGNQLMPFPETLIIDYEYFKPCVNYYIKYEKLSLEEAVNKEIIKLREYAKNEDYETVHTELWELYLPKVEGDWLVNEVPNTDVEFYIKIVDPETEE